MNLYYCVLLPINQPSNVTKVITIITKFACKNVLPKISMMAL